MKPVFLVPLFGALVLAQTAPEECQCPLVNCLSYDAVALCNCLNSRETLCKERCPDYEPTYLPCPIRPTSIPTSTPTSTFTPIFTSSLSTILPPPTTACECEPIFCIAAWPQSCYCRNAAKQKCHDKCGGVPPNLQACPPSPSAPSFVVRPVAERLSPSSTPSRGLPPKNPPPTPTISVVPKPTGTHAPCGGNRSNYLSCDEGFVCIKDPYKLGCGPECDGFGICVEDKMCGGFAGFSCQKDGQECVDDPRDACVPKSGGADCGGLCVWPH